MVRSQPRPTSRVGVKNVSGVGMVGECLSSQITFWKRNDLTCQQREASWEDHAVGWEDPQKDLVYAAAEGAKCLPLCA